MKKALFALLLATSLALLPGCVSMTRGTRDPDVTTNLARKDYEILGPVSIESDLTSILGLVNFGGKGYSDLLEKAKTLYPETDALIDLYTDARNVIVLGIYNRSTVVYSATAIKVTDAVPGVN